MNLQNVPTASTIGQATPNPRRAPQVPSASRNTSAAVTQGLVQLSSRLQSTEDRLAIHQATISELQMSGAESKDKQEEHTVEIELLKAQVVQVKAHLGIILEALGIDLNGPDLPADAPSGTVRKTEVLPKQPTGTRTEARVGETSPIVAAGPSSHTIKTEPALLAGNQPSEKIQLMIRTEANTALALIYGETVFSLSKHGDYPGIPKSHADWPHHMDEGKRVPLHRFDFCENYASNKNKDTYEAWVTTTHNRLKRPALRATPGQPTGSDIDRKAVVSVCSKVYAAHKSRYKKLVERRRGPTVPIKRKAETQELELELPIEGEGVIAGQIDSAIPVPVPISGPKIGTDATGNFPQDFSFTGYLHSDLVDSVGAISIPEDTADVVDATHLACFSQSSADLLVPDNVAKLSDAQDDVKPFQGLTSNYGGTRRQGANNHPDTIRSRKVVKCNMRLRKRPYLTGESEKYKAPKYDTYFTPGAMSEDEEIVDEMEDGCVKSTHFEAHAVDYASDEFIAIRVAIDAMPDPNTTNKTRRERGADKTSPPNVSQTPETGMRTWMINKEVMAENPRWIDEHRVYTSGASWSEPEPSHLQGARRAIKKIRLEALSGLALARHADSGALLAQQKHDDYMNSRMI